jgi:outer membrane protein OmpA-like peptidoglycan-associated protein
MTELKRKVTLKHKNAVEKPPEEEPPQKKNKLLLPLSISLLLVLLIVGAYFLFRGNPTPEVVDIPVPEPPMADTVIKSEPKDSVTVTEPKIPYEQGKTYKIYQFSFGKFDYSQPDLELDKLTEVMKEHPNMKIQIFAYTDKVSSAEFNQVLSEKRAKTICDYLVSKGIDKERLSCQGKGISTKYDNDAENRRVEFILN